MMTRTHFYPHEVDALPHAEFFRGQLADCERELEAQAAFEMDNALQDADESAQSAIRDYRDAAERAEHERYIYFGILDKLASALLRSDAFLLTHAMKMMADVLLKDATINAADHAELAGATEFLASSM